MELTDLVSVAAVVLAVTTLVASSGRAMCWAILVLVWIALGMQGLNRQPLVSKIDMRLADVMISTTIGAI